LGEDRLRMAKLIDHWAHHNDEHGGRFAETAAEAERMGLGAVAEELRRAADESKKVSGHLLKALRLLGEGEG
jgi:hypothetical protein